jgi:hypothetical protein
METRNRADAHGRTMMTRVTFESPSGRADQGSRGCSRSPVPPPLVSARAAVESAAAGSHSHRGDSTRRRSPPSSWRTWSRPGACGLIVRGRSFQRPACLGTEGNNHEKTSLADSRRHQVIVSPYLLVEDVAARLRCSTRTIHELTRTARIPHRRLPASRRCLFLLDELERWEAGATLQLRNLPRGGRVVSPIDSA